MNVSGWWDCPVAPSALRFISPDFAFAIRMRPVEREEDERNAQRTADENTWPLSSSKKQDAVCEHQEDALSVNRGSIGSSISPPKPSLGRVGFEFNSIRFHANELPVGLLPPRQEGFI